MAVTRTSPRARGGRVVVAFSGSPKYYLQNGYFSFEKWKSRVNRFRGINLSQFIKDGTIVGHYMIDEPNDPANWRGRPVSPHIALCWATATAAFGDVFRTPSACARAA